MCQEHVSLMLPLERELQNGDKMRASYKAELCQRYVQKLLPESILREATQAPAGLEENLEVVE